MKLAIMQPYFLPYIGYFQLINAVDTFVIYDDVNYIKQGWINRNYILLNGGRHLINLGLNGASSFKLINQIKIGTNRNKLVKTISQSYTKAPYFKEIFPVIKECLLFKNDNLAEFVTNSLQSIANTLNIKTKFVFSSDIENDKALNGQDKIVNINKCMGADNYTNPIGGVELYSNTEFDNNGIKLNFLKTKEITYKQFSNEFIPNLSIIDVMMFNSKEEVQELLELFILKENE